jgi:hypothetical protein
MGEIGRSLGKVAVRVGEVHFELKVTPEEPGAQ